MKVLLRLLPVLLLALTGAGSASAQRVQPADPHRWDSEIQAFVVQDSLDPATPGGIVFTGSSSIRMWTSLAEDFPETNVTRRGVGGSHLADIVFFVDRLVLRHEPRMVVLYAGENDLTHGISPQQVLADFHTFVTAVHDSLPEAQIAYVSAKPSPSRWHLADKYQTANDLIRCYTESDERLAFIDVFEPMLGEDGEPREDLFLQDMLHMNAEGYRIWQETIEPYLEEAVDE